MKLFKYLSILCSVVFVTPVMAAHLKGGYVEYRYVGPGTGSNAIYRVIIYQYLDCGSASGQVDQDVFIGVFNARTNVAFISNLIVPLAGTMFANKGSFNCITNPPPVCYRIDRYEATIELPLNVGGYNVTVQRCCRIPGIVNVSNSANIGVAYSIIIPSADTIGRLLQNNSPVFAQKDTALVCADNAFQFPFEATDADGDSLVYKFTPGLNTPLREAKPAPQPPPYPFVDYNSGFTAEFPLGDRVSIDSKTGIISGIAPSAPGQYIVAVMVEEYRNGEKVAEARKEIHVTVGNCDIVAAELPVQITNCRNFTVNFESLSTSSGITSYYWDFGVPGTNADISTAPRPSYTYPDTGIYMAKLVINRDGFCPDSTTTEVRVFPQFTPAFTVDGVCQKVPYQFTDRSTSTHGLIDTWFWNFGVPGTNADTSRVQNPVFTYPAPGTYTASLRVQNNKGCIDTAVVQVQVPENPVINLAFRDTLICSIDSLPLFAQASGPAGGNYSWSPSANTINANTQNPIVFPKATTTYIVNFDDRGCTASDTVRVNVLDFITVNAGNDTTICLTDIISLRAETLGLGYRWTPATGLSDSRIANPTVQPLLPTNTFVVTANLGKCEDTDTIVVRTVPYPVVTAGNDTTICFGDRATLYGFTDATNYTWSPAGLVSNSSQLVSLANPADTTTFTLTVTGTIGCPKPVSSTMLVRVVARVIPFAGNDTNVVIGQPLQLNGSANAPVFSWSPASGLSNPNIANPVLTVTPGMVTGGQETLTYILTASAPEGCRATDEIVIRIFTTPPSIFVPNAFTPNSDGRNDIIRPVLAGMRQLEYFRIYNRYGQLVFETRQDGRGWDGRINGQLQATGTYVFAVQAIDFTGEVKREKGTFVLIR